jgi:hypothetical protein
MTFISSMPFITLKECWKPKKYPFHSRKTKGGSAPFARLFKSKKIGVKK